MNFISKGNTLKKLRIKNAIIPNLYIFTVKEYKIHKNKIRKCLKRI